MADRNNRLIFSDFFASSSNLISSASVVNTTAKLEPGEVIHESNTSRARVNLSAVTQSYVSSSYLGDFIPLDDINELRSFEYPRPYQVFSLRNPKKLFYFDPTDTASIDDNTNIIVTSGSRRYIAYRPEAGLEAPFYVSGSLTVSESVIDPRNIKYWGAVGNGIVDDTQAIQRCVDYVSESGGGTVYVPSTPNYYKTTYPIELKYKTIIEGDGETSWIYNQSTRSLAEGIAFTSRVFTMGTMNQTFYIRASRSAYLPISASDEYVEIDPQPYSAPANWYNVQDIILIRNGNSEIGTGSFEGSSFAELRRIVSKSENRLYLDVPFFENVSPISASATASDANYPKEAPAGDYPWNQFIKGPGYSFITKMTPGYLGRDDFSASLFIADEIGLKNLKISSLSGSFMADGAAYKPLFEDIFFENCNQGIVVNGYAFGTMRNIKGRKFAGRPLESAEGCHDNLYENLDLVRGGRGEILPYEDLSFTDALVALRVRDKLVNSKIYSPVVSASVNVNEGEPSSTLIPIANFIVCERGATVENCELGAISNAGSAVVVRGNDSKIVNNRFTFLNNTEIIPGIRNSQPISIPSDRGNIENVIIHSNIFNVPTNQLSNRLVFIQTSSVSQHRNISIQHNIFYVNKRAARDIYYQASSSIFANNLIFNTAADNPSLPLLPITINVNSSNDLSVYNNVYYNSSIGRMVLQNDSLQVFNSNINFNSLPDVNPGIVGQLYKTGSEALGLGAGHTLVLISQ